jgi:hypothetical protein
MYCDLVFTNENEDFIHWVEYLEEHIQTTIYKNKDRWFESSLELKDIEVHVSFQNIQNPVNSICWELIFRVGLERVVWKYSKSPTKTVDIENITPILK